MRTGWQPKAAGGSSAAGFLPAVVRRRRIAAVLVLLFVVASWLIFSSSTFFKSSPNQYVLVIDAGSSGTRMNAFTWHAPSTPQGLPTLHPIPPDAAPHKVPRRALETRRAYKRVETEPGMDKFAENVGKLEQTALEPLLEWSRAVIPRSRWPSTPVFLLGTAGLRKLNGNHRERVMNEARSVLRRCGFRFEDPWARVLDGNDEGIYAWVALNAAEGKLGTQNTVGALDLGGSSLQVTFAMDNEGIDVKNGAGMGTQKGATENISSPSSSSVNVSLLGVHHTLYTHSHHHFGLDDAFERSVTILLEEQNNHINSNSNSTTGGGGDGKIKINTGNGSGGGTKSGKRQRDLLLVDQQPAVINKSQLGHPCLHKGYKKTYNRIPLEGRMPSPATVTLLGRPDAAACSHLATQVVTSHTECDAPPCALGTPQPRAAGKFIALAGFYVVSHFFNLGTSAGVAAVAKAGSALCPLSWDEIQSRHAGEMAVETYCFRTAYIAALIPQGLGLKEDQVVIGEGTAGWTLGAALVEGHRNAGLGGKTEESGNNSKLSTTKMSGIPHWSDTILPWWTGRAAAGILAVLLVAALVLAYKRGQDAVTRAARPRSSSGILSAAEFGSQEPGNGNNNYNLSNGSGGGDGFLSGVFFRLFGAGASKSSSTTSVGKKTSPPSAFWQPGTNENGPSFSYEENYTSLNAVGSSRALSLTRSATYSRRLSALESATSEQRIGG